MNDKDLDRIAELVLKKLGYLNKKFFTSKEAASYLGLALKTLYKLVYDKKIKARKPNGKCYVFDRADLDNYLNKDKQ